MHTLLEVAAAGTSEPGPMVAELRQCGQDQAAQEVANLAGVTASILPWPAPRGGRVYSRRPQARPTEAATA